MMEFRVYPLIALLALALATSCGTVTGQEREKDEGPDTPAPVACTATEECPVAQLCEDGECVAVPVGSPCESDEECGNEASCADQLPGGYCTVSCESLDDCPAGSVCVVQGGEGICLAECEGHDECRDDYVCTGGYCFLPCESDAECEGGQVCIGGVCEGAGVGRACGDSSDCETDLECAIPDRGGYCTTGCGEGESCPVGSVCGSMFGEETCLAACRAEEDCRQGEICHQGGCVPRCAEGDCPEGTYCGDAGFCRTPASSGLTEIDLGHAAAGQRLEFEVPEGTHSVTIIVHGDQSNTYQFTSLVDPTGEERITGIIEQFLGQGAMTAPHRTMPRAEINATQIPNSDTPGMELIPGSWSFTFDGGAANAYILLKEGGEEGGSVPLNIFVSPEAFPGYDASNLATSEHFQGVLAEWDRFFRDQANVSISGVSYFDLPDEYNELDINVTSGMMGYEEMFSKFSRDDGLNVFFIRAISFNMLGSGGGVAGIAGGIPGPARTGQTYHSGIVIAVQEQPLFTGLTFAHEAGHFFGLFHVSENILVPGLFNEIHDMLSDTPSCRPPDDGCDEAKRHLMFPLLEAEMELLSPVSVQMIRANAAIDVN